MPSPSSLPPPDVLDPKDRQALERFVTWNLDRGFRLAVVEAENHAEREQILAPLLPVLGPRVLQVDLAQLEGHNLWHELLTLYKESEPRLLVLSGVVSGTAHDYMRQLNVQRDLFTRDMKVPWIVLLHPAQRVPLLTIAPDFSDYVVLWIRKEQSSPDESPLESSIPPMPLLLPSAPLPEGVHPLLQQASTAMDAAQLDQAQDLLYRCDLLPDLPKDMRFLRRILGARLLALRGKFQVAANNLRSLQGELAALPDSVERRGLSYLIECDLGTVMLCQGRIAAAETHLRQALALAEQESGPGIHAAALENLAGLLVSFGTITEARQLLQASWEIRRQWPHSSPAEIISLGLRFNQLLLEEGQYAEAGKGIRLLLDEMERHPTVDEATMRVARSLLGAALFKQGRFAEAEGLLRHCLTETESTMGSAHWQYALALGGLGRALWEQGRVEEAEDLLRRSVQLVAETLGESHPSYAGSLGFLADVLLKQGKLADAEALQRRALAIEENALGTNHASLGSTVANLAGILLRQGRAAEALPLAVRAVTIAERSLGERHPDTAQALIRQAEVQAKLGQPQARQTAQRAVEVLEQSLGGEHPVTQRAVKLLHELNAKVDSPLLAAG